ncbi:homoserine O-acetyltransferase family protein [Parafilimonas sp.]|uniref:homoserine O-acetyltransferase family protein n=1 Tax=Parafilimonas sp. TaxID=1969739 RepID=UPI0039E56484
MSKTFTCNKPFKLESGSILNGFHLAYTTHGKMNADKSNVVWIFHALTANSDPAEWWGGLVGNDKFFDPKKYFIVCVNMPGSCYGSINAFDINPATNHSWYHAFPWFTTRDMIRAYQHLKSHLGITKIHIGIGGSMGGQQLLEWSIEEPELFQYIIPIATNAFHSAWGVAFNASQRLAIENDITWKEQQVDAGLEGMKTARSIALLSYRSYDTYKLTQKITSDDLNSRERSSESYQQYQGEKLAKRFNAFSYYFLSKGMDNHNVGRGRESAVKALEQIKAKALVIGISSDLLFPPTEQEFIAAHIPYAEFREIHSPYGHDGFLLEYEQIEEAIKTFLASSQPFSRGEGQEGILNFLTSKI